MSAELSAALVATFLGGALTGVGAALGIILPKLSKLSERLAVIEATQKILAENAEKPSVRCTQHDERIAAMYHEIEMLRDRQHAVEARMQQLEDAR